MTRDVRELVHDLQACGWRVKPSRRHLKLVAPTGRTVCISRTPSDRSRATQNQIADLRRALR